MQADIPWNLGYFSLFCLDTNLKLPDIFSKSFCGTTYNQMGREVLEGLCVS